MNTQRVEELIRKTALAQGVRAIRIIYFKAKAIFHPCADVFHRSYLLIKDCRCEDGGLLFTVPSSHAPKTSMSERKNRDSYKSLRELIPPTLMIISAQAQLMT